MTIKEPTPYSLSELRSLLADQLPEACQRVRQFMVRETHEKAGHMASSLGVVELTIALHYVLQTPEDLLVWDVGHQAYAHKIVTDRAALFSTQRKRGGLSGFPKRTESPFDSFGAGHSSTALSALVGMALADRHFGRLRNRVAVVGDGALTAGLCFEALNHGGSAGVDVLMILNDNGLSIEPTQGALHQQGPAAYASFFTSLGWKYTACVDGNALPELLPALQSALQEKGPRVLHVKTHRPEPATFGANEGTPETTSFQRIFAESLKDRAKEDKKIWAITPAMAPGCSMDLFREVYPQRFVDVGIAEQHALTMAAGMATQGLRPVVNMYSTFSQRAVDQWIHDIALQELPVVLCLDRSGVVGEDGPTHHGVFDIALFKSIPQTNIWVPFDASSLRWCLQKALESKKPAILRYPRGKAPDDLPTSAELEAVVLLRQGDGVLHWALGPMAHSVFHHEPFVGQAVCAVLQIKPFPWDKLEEMCSTGRYHTVHFWEDGQAVGGFGETMAAWMAQRQTNLSVFFHGYEDAFVSQGSMAELRLSPSATKDGKGQ